MGCSTAREAYSRNSKWMPRARFIDADYSVGIARRFCHREAHRHGNTSEISARIVCDVYIIAGTTGSRRSVTRWFASNGDDARMRTLGNNKASKENRFSLSLSLSLSLSHEAIRQWNASRVADNVNPLQSYVRPQSARCFSRKHVRECDVGELRGTLESYKAVYTAKLYAARGKIWHILELERYVSLIDLFHQIRSGFPPLE